MKNNRKNGIFIIVFLLIFSLIATAAVINSQSTSTLVSMNDVDIPNDGSDWGLLRIDDVTDLGSCDIVISWDPDVVAVSDVDGSDFDSMNYYVDDSAGMLSVNAFSYDTLNGDLTIAEVMFEPASGAIAGNMCNLEIADSLLLSADPIPSEMLHNRINGQAKIYAAGSIVAVSVGDVNIPNDGSKKSIIRVNDVSDLGSCDIVISWDPDVVAVSDVDGSDFDSMNYYVDDSAGMLSVNAFSYDTLNGDLTIAEVMFEPASGAIAGNMCNLEIADSLLLSADPIPSEMLHNRINGQAKIYAAGSIVAVSVGDVNIPNDGSKKSIIRVNDVSDLGSCDIVISWDPDVVAVSDVDGSDFDSMNYYVDDSAGMLSVNAFSYDTLNGDLTIAEVMFEPASGAIAGNMCNLEIADSLLLSADPIPSEIIHIRIDGIALITNDVSTSLISMDDIMVPEDGSDWGLIRVNDVSDLGSCDINLLWDSSVLSLISAGESDFDTMNYYVDDSAGMISISAFSYDNMNGDFTIAKLTFEPASGASAGDECNLQITNSLLLTADPIPTEILHNILDGTALIKTSAPSGGGGTGGGDLPPTENQKPNADASASDTFGYVNNPVRFDGSLSNDDDGVINLYEWDWNNDGIYDYGSASTITTNNFNNIGTYPVTLRVTDNEGATDENTINVEIIKLNNPPADPVITGPTIGQKNIDYEFTVISTDSDNDTIQYFFDWNDGGISTTEFLSNGTTAKQSHSWNSPGKYVISVKAYDNETESASVKYTILIDVLPIDNGITGYFIDDDSDGVYDSFENSVTGEKTDIEIQNDGTYLVDSDGDGQWDYTFDTESGITMYEKEEETPGFELLVIFCALSIMLLLIFLRRKQK